MKSQQKDFYLVYIYSALPSVVNDYLLQSRQGEVDLALPVHDACGTVRKW